MSEIKTQDACFAAKAKIQQFYKKRLMFQYKKESWQNTFNDFLEVELRKLHNEIVKEVNNFNKEVNDELLKQFIPKPSTSLGSRLKFLFTGKF